MSATSVAAASFAVEFVRDRESKTPFPAKAKLAYRLKEAAMTRGLMIYPSSGCADGILGDHVLLAPPYIVSAADVEMIVERFAQAVDAAIEGL